MGWVGLRYRKWTHGDVWPIYILSVRHKLLFWVQRGAVDVHLCLCADVLIKTEAECVAELRPLPTANANRKRTNERTICGWPVSAVDVRLQSSFVPAGDGETLFPARWLPCRMDGWYTAPVPATFPQDWEVVLEAVGLFHWCSVFAGGLWSRATPLPVCWRPGRCHSPVQPTG